MGLLQKALTQKDHAPSVGTAGLLNRALSVKYRIGPEPEELSPASEKKNYDIGETIADRIGTEPESWGTAVQTDIHENLPPDAVRFIRDSIADSRSILLIKLHVHFLRDKTVIFDQMVRALTAFLSDRSVIFSNEDNTIGILFAFETVDQELLIDQIRKIIRIDPEYAGADFSYTVDCIFDIQTQ